MQTFELADGGLLLYQEGFLPSPEADRYLSELLASTKWEQKAAAFGYRQPRLTASFGDAGLCYRYSRTLNFAEAWTPTLREIKDRIESVKGHYNFCLLNRYRSGQDSIGMHADNEPEMGNVIGSLSLGATRTFRVRHNVSKQSFSLAVRHGTLIIMAGTMQQHWKHGIPKTTAQVGERINLTFREIHQV